MEDIKWTRLTEVLNEFADAFIQNARNNLDANQSNDTYNLYNSFEKVIEVGEDYFTVSISLADYWQYVENGRGPGKFPPVDKIKEWIEVKPINPTPLSNGKTPSVEQLSFLISRKIANEGTEGKPFFEPAKEQTIREFEDKINQAIDEDVSNFILKLVEKEMRDMFS